MPTTPTDVYAPQTYRLDPFYRQDLAAQIHVNLADGTYARGAVLGEVPGSPGTYDHILDTVQVAPTGGATLTTPTGGSLAAGDYTVGYAWVGSDGVESALSPLATTTAAGNDVVHVAAVTKPANVASVNWYLSRGAGDPNLAFILNNDGSAADFATAPTSAAAAAPTTAAGGGKAKAILRDACTVSSGNIALASDSRLTVKSAPAYVGGGAHFKTEEISGLTAKAITDLGASLISGTVADGVLRF